jgi:hypothetical protein
LATFGLDLRLFGLFSPASSESPFGRNQKAEAEGEPTECNEFLIRISLS